jgi:PAS domain S-box-containing protein
MTKSRKGKVSEDVHRPDRKREHAPAQEPADRAAEELAWLARLARENPDPVLRVSAERVLLYRTIFDTTSDGIFLHDLETLKLTMCNQSFLQMLGYTEEEFAQLSVADIHAEADLPFIYAQIEEFLRGGKPVRHDVRFQRKDGSIVFADVSPDLVRLDGRRYLVVALKDITERKRVEQVLTASERKYRSLVQNIPDVTWTTDRQGRTLFISSNVRNVYGYSAEEIYAGGDSWLGNIHPDDRPRVEKAFDELFTQKKPYDVEYRIRRKDGTWIWLHDRSVTSYEQQGQSYADGVFSDITERKRMEEEIRQHTEHLEELVAARTGALQESETRYRSLYHTIADGIFVMGADGRIADVNDSACAQLGYTREELIGLPVATISARSDFHLGEILDRLHTGGSLSYETTHCRKDGTAIPVELSLALVEYRGQPAVLGVARDITERKRAEESLQFTQFAVDHTADAAFWMTEDGRFSYVNKAACQALGYSREELAEMTIYDIDPAFTEPMWRESWRRLKAQKSIVLETVHRAKDGRIYPVEVRANYLEFGGREYDCAFARDITERKRTEDALRASEERFRTMADQAPIMIGVTNEKGEITFLNQAWLDFRGRTLEEEAGWNWAEEVHPEDRDRVVTAMQSAIERRERYSLEYRIRDCRGDYRWVLDTASPLLRPDGEPRGYIGTALDITERKRAEEAVAESRKRYRGLVEKINDWVWEIDADGVYTYASPRVLELLGYAPEEIVGKTPFDLMPPAEAQRVWNAFQPIWLERKPLELVENTLVRKDGRLVTVETSGMPVFAEDGAFLGYTGIDRDVTERKRAQEALREKEYLLSESQRIGHIGSWSVDLATRVATWTHETYRLLGVAPDTFVPSADTLIALLHPDDRDAMREWIRAALAGSPPEALEFRVPLPDGSVRVLIGRGELIYADDHRPLRLVGTAQDITQRRQAEEALRRLNERLELQVAERTEELRHTVDRLQQLTLELSQAEDRERKRIADILHDDVQQTLAAAKFHLNLLSTEPRTAQESREIVEQVKGMLKDAIEKSRRLSHELSPALYQVDLTAILEWLARQMREKHGLTVRVEVHGALESPSEPLKAFLYKVVQELLFNVVKHADVHEARIRVRRRGRYLRLAVIDKGRGFDPHRLEAAPGFGLLGIRERVQLLGGRMKIKSARGVGSTFLISLPYEPAAPALDAVPDECQAVLDARAVSLTP